MAPVVVIEKLIVLPGQVDTGEGFVLITGFTHKQFEIVTNKESFVPVQVPVASTI